MTPGPQSSAFAKILRLTLAASPAFVSQLTFSVVSFFSVAGLSRLADEYFLACVMAAYSLESLQVSWLDARLVNYLVLRGPQEPTRGDIHHVLRTSLVTAVLGAPLLLMAGYLVNRDLATALLTLLWVSAMCAVDLTRYLASRYHSTKTIGSIGGFHVLVAVPLCLLWKGDVVRLMLILTGLCLVCTAAYCHALLRHRSGAVSPFWREEKAFGHSLGIEAAASSAATGLSGTLLAWINPRISVGLQLANQIIAMPATVLTQAISLPLSRDLRANLDNGRFPRKLVLLWIAVSLALPLVILAAIYPLSPLVYTLLGERAKFAYLYTPAITIQTMAMLGWQPLTMARRWIAGPANVRRHVTSTIIVYYAMILGVAFLTTESSVPTAMLIVALFFAASVGIRVVLWLKPDETLIVQPRRILTDESM